ncbi:kinase-like domain-containing protein [Coprinopsis sp. MPI-PUGE-AT-0042]|nr:kinase-like domain-containing protein [Coprinopsis sp. MPI-PUGE-AT-0042]
MAGRKAWKVEGGWEKDGGKDGRRKAGTFQSDLHTQPNRHEKEGNSLEKSIFVRIGKICNYDGGSYRSEPAFFAVTNEFLESTPMSKVLKHLHHAVDSAYTAHYERRIYQKDAKNIHLMWALNKSQADPALLDGTVGELWNEVAFNTIFVKMADRKKHCLDLWISVKINLIDDETEKPTRKLRPHHETNLTSLASMSRVRAHSAGIDGGASGAKRQRLSVSGHGAYVTGLDLTEAQVYTVIRYSWLGGAGPAGKVSFVEDPSKAQVVVEKTEFASGQTKTAYRVYFLGDSSKKYAAKCFYNVGDATGAVSHKVNFVNLRDELLRAHNIKTSVKSFLQHAEESEVSVSNLSVDDTFILKVVEGKMKEHAWIVDPLYEGADVLKFSGTSCAGNNNDTLLGRTCNAFAHYSWSDSEGSVVWVDIEGIKTSSMAVNSHRQGPWRFVLFDLLRHTDDQFSGLGDRGFIGIYDFLQDHQCNAICQDLGLKEMDSNADEPTPSRPASRRSNTLGRSADSHSDTDILDSNSKQQDVQPEVKGNAHSSKLVQYNGSSDNESDSD